MNFKICVSNDKKLGIIFSLINTLGLGLVGLVDKIGTLKTNSALFFSAQSIFFALIFTLVFFLTYYKKSSLAIISTTSFSSWKRIFAVGIFSSGLFILLRFLGLTQTTGTFAALSQVVTTCLTAILAFVILKERLSRSFWPLFLIIITSIYFVSLGKISVANIKTGDLLILCGAIFLAYGNILSKVAVKHVSPLALALGRFFFGFIFLLSTSTILLGISNYPIQFEIFALISGLLWAIMVIAFNFAIKRIGVTFTTSLLLTAPVITMVLESIVLQRSFNLVQIIGAIVSIICGIMIVKTSA